MKAIQVREYGGPEVLQYVDVPVPTPGPGEALVEVRAVGLNYADVTSRIGRYRPELPWIPGNEASGIVRQVEPNSAGIAVGDRVAWATAPAGLKLRYAADDENAGSMRDTVASTYAEYAVAPAASLIRVPPTLSYETAAAVVMQGVTAQYLATSAYSIQPGDGILIHAGAGGVGYLLTQFAKALGATVYTTVSSEEKAAFSREMGADEVIIYTEVDFHEVVMELTDGHGVHAVYDSVGAVTFDGSLASLMPRGYLLVYGQASGPVLPFDISRLNTGSYYISRPSIAHYAHTRAELEKRSSAVFDGVISRDIRVHVYREYSLPDAADAHRDLEDRHVIGKIVLVPR